MGSAASDEIFVGELGMGMRGYCRNDSVLIIDMRAKALIRGSAIALACVLFNI